MGRDLSLDDALEQARGLGRDAAVAQPSPRSRRVDG
jgi:hypothetical protein